MIATHLICLGSRVVDKTMVIGETGSPFSPVAYRLLGTQTPDEIFPAIRLPVDTAFRAASLLRSICIISRPVKFDIDDTVSGKQTGIQSQETQWAGSLGT